MKIDNLGNYAKKGNIPWNKGKTGIFKHTEEWKQEAKERMLGNKYTFGMRWKIKDTSNLKGFTGKHTEETKKKMSDSRMGTPAWNEGIKNEKSHLWRGEEAGVATKHIWIFRTVGNPNHCEDCGKEGKKIRGRWNIHWSNIDHKYRRILEDYTGRCPSCHKIYDLKNNLKQKYY